MDMGSSIAVQARNPKPKTRADCAKDQTLCQFLLAEFGTAYSRLCQQLEFSQALQDLPAVFAEPGSLALRTSSRALRTATPGLASQPGPDFAGLLEVKSETESNSVDFIELSKGSLRLAWIERDVDATADLALVAKQMLLAVTSRVFDSFFKQKIQAELVRMFSLQELTFVGWVLLSGSDLGRKALSGFAKCRDSKAYANRVFKVLARSAKRFEAWKGLLEQLGQPEGQESQTQSQCSVKPGRSRKSDSKLGLVIPVDSPRADCRPLYYSTIETMKCNKIKRDSLRSQLQEQRLQLEESSTKENSVFFSVNQHSKAAPRNSLPFRRSQSQFGKGLEPMTMPASAMRSFSRFSDIHCVATPRGQHPLGRPSVQLDLLGSRGGKALLAQSRDRYSNEERELEEALCASQSQDDLSKIEERIEELRAELAKAYAAGLEEFFARRECSRLGLSAGHRDAFREKLARGEECLVDKITDLLFDCYSKQLSAAEVAQVLQPSEPRTEGAQCEVETFLRSAVRLVSNEGFLQGDELWKITNCIQSGDAEVIEALAEDLAYYAQYRDFKGLVNGLSELLQQL